MGMIIAPILLLALILGIISIVLAVIALVKKTAGIKEVIIGLLTAVSIYGIIVFFYLNETSVWALSPYFRLPIFMIYFPFILFLLTKIGNVPALKKVSTIMLFTVANSTLLAVIFNVYFFGILDLIGIQGTH